MFLVGGGGVTNPTGTSNGSAAPIPNEGARGFSPSASLIPGFLSALWCLCAIVDLTAVPHPGSQVLI